MAKSTKAPSLNKGTRVKMKVERECAGRAINRVDRPTNSCLAPVSSL